MAGDQRSADLPKPVVSDQLAACTFARLPATYSFDIAGGRIRAIYIVRNPDKLRAFLERTH